MGKSQSKDRINSVQRLLKMTSGETDSLLKRFFQLTQNRRSLSREQFFDTIRLSLRGQEFDQNLWAAVFDMLDLNGDNSIDFYEFSISMVYGSKLSLDKKIDYLFQMMDFNKDGAVSVEEMNRAIKTVSRIANNAERVWDLEEYFPSLAQKSVLSKKEFKEALMTPKGQELMNVMSLDI